MFRFLKKKVETTHLEIKMIHPITREEIIIGGQFLNEVIKRGKKKAIIDTLYFHPSTVDMNSDLFTFCSKTGRLRMYVLHEDTDTLIKFIYFGIIANFNRHLVYKDEFIERFKEEYTLYLINENKDANDELC